MNVGDTIRVGKTGRLAEIVFIVSGLAVLQTPGGVVYDTLFPLSDLAAPLEASVGDTIRIREEGVEFEVLSATTRRGITYFLLENKVTFEVIVRSHGDVTSVADSGPKR